jgi:hypothetical protein
MRFNRQTFGKILLSGLVLGLLIGPFLVNPLHAAILPWGTSSGAASINYNSITFSRTDLNWFDQTAVPPLDMRGSFSGAATTLNGYIDPYNASFIDGAPWGNTSASSNASDTTGTVTGSAYTNYPGDPLANPANPSVFSSANVTMFTPGFGSVDVAQAGLFGQFTVPTNGILTITAQYQLAHSLAFNGAPGSGFASSSVAAGLTLSDFWGYDPITGQSPILASDTSELTKLINGLSLSSYSANGSGTLAFTYNLLATDAFGVPIVYDFEAWTSANGAVAPVPLPSSLLFLLTGIPGLWIFRKRLI